MTLSPPLEAEYIRGNSLSPASPIPVHVPAPHKIPVLENQIDPVFNLMSTHMGQPPLQDNYKELHSMPQGVVEQESRSPASELFETSKNSVQGDRSVRSEGNENNGGGFQEQQAWLLPTEPNINQKHLTSKPQPPASLDAPESPSMPAQNDLPRTQEVVESMSEKYPPYRQVPEYATSRVDASNPTSNTTTESVVLNQASTSFDFEDANPTTVSNIPAPSATDHSTNENPISNVPADGVDVIKPFNPGVTQPSLATLPVPIGLPARPPPQEKPAIHPNYAQEEDIRSYHIPTAHPEAPSSHNAHSINPYPPNSKHTPKNGAAPNGMAPLPSTTFQQPGTNLAQPQRSPQTAQPLYGDNYGRIGGRSQDSHLEANTSHVRIPEIEKAFDQFLLDEANYTSQGQWEKFPPGSRLFVGNLFTEKVSKRDIFYIFSKYGRLAQISMKSAYGFVQYIKADDCQRAMQSEQGIQIRGRKINLEISKPQKNTRNAAAAIAQGNELRAAYARRSRSPEYGRNGPSRGFGRNGGDRFDKGPGYNDHRGRDEYRPLRSPSPRAMRTHDSYRGGRDRSPDRYHGGRRTRSRSPAHRGGSYRDRSPGLMDPDDEATLPIARRPAGSAPDVQIILAEEVDRTFVGYIQQSFRERSLRCEVLQLPRVSLNAVVKRQILEGVQAVVKIFRRSQVTGKIPLQVFNRSQGLNDVQFDEYEDLDAATAAEIVVRARSTHSVQPQMQQYPPRPAFGPPQGGPGPQSSFPMPNAPLQQMSSQQSPGGPAPPSIANSISPLDGQTLQKLLTSVSQTSQISQNNHSFHATPQPGGGPDLAAILSGVSRQQGPQQAHQQQSSYAQISPPGLPQQAYQQHGSQHSGYSFGGPQQQQYPQQPPQNFQGSQPTQLGVQPQQANVQEIMAQLARYGQR